MDVKDSRSSACSDNEVHSLLKKQGRSCGPAHEDRSDKGEFKVTRDKRTSSVPSQFTIDQVSLISGGGRGGGSLGGNSHQASITFTEECIL